MIWKDKRNEFCTRLSQFLLSQLWQETDLSLAMEDLGADWAETLATHLINKFPKAPSEIDLYRELLDIHQRHDQWDLFEWDEEELDISFSDNAFDLANGIDAVDVPESKLLMNQTNHKALNDVGDLLSFLNLDLTELEFLSDYGFREKRKTNKKLQNYHYVLKKKRHGFRLLEIPKELLKQCQQRIHREILSKLPVHEAACAYVKEKTIRDFAQPHTDQKFVLKLDLDNFFTRIRPYQVQEIFLQAAYPHLVAKFLTGLCVNCPPQSQWSKIDMAYRSAHLPQGAPTSPAFSNLCFAELDRRLALAAQKVGVTYTRYADDLAFSGDFRPEQFRWSVVKIIDEAGFSLNHRKTRIQSRNQRQALCNITVNDGVNCARKEYDQLKAILHNCLRFGPESQNRAQHPYFKCHLRGRIQYLTSLNKTRGLKLLNSFEKICWDAQ